MQRSFRHSNVPSVILNYYKNIVIFHADSICERINMVQEFSVAETHVQVNLSGSMYVEDYPQYTPR